MKPEKLILERVLPELENSGFDMHAAGKMELLEDFIRELLHWSARIHLVGKGRVEETVAMLLMDSLLMLRSVEGRGIFGDAGLGGGGTGRGENGGGARGEAGALKLADIGTGAGFPGVVWKIMRPRLDITLFERRQKPLFFLERAISTLNLGSIRAVGEDASLHKGSSFDLALSKAAGGLPEILPVAEALLLEGGLYVTLKGSAWRSEMEGVKPGLMKLEEKDELPGGRGILLIFKKMPKGRVEVDRRERK